MKHLLPLLLILIFSQPVVAQERDASVAGNLSNNFGMITEAGGQPRDAISSLYERVKNNSTRPPDTLVDQFGEAFPEFNKTEYDHINVTRVSVDHASRSLFVPSISDIQAGRELIVGENLFLEDWYAESDRGKIYVSRSNGGQNSRIEIVAGLVLGEFGRVLGVMEHNGIPSVILESGDEITGRPDS
jgi:hypothetical protein